MISDMSDAALVTEIEDDPRPRFVTGGKPGPGRPRGGRNKIAENFITAYCEDFQVHGKAVIEKVRVENPAFYLKIGIDLLPKDVNLRLDGGDMFVVRAPTVAMSSEEWATAVSSPEKTSAEIIDLKPIDASPMLPEPTGD